MTAGPGKRVGRESRALGVVVVVAVVTSARALVLFSNGSLCINQQETDSSRGSSGKRQGFSIRKSKAYLGGDEWGEKTRLLFYDRYTVCNQFALV